VLAHSRFFAGLPADQIAEIDRRMQVRGYTADEAIYQVGQPASTLFVLATGRVKLVRPALDGQDVLVDVVTPGGLFGTLSSLGEPSYPDTAQALTVSCALGISAEQFREVLRAHPGVALAVLDDLAGRLEQAHQSLRHRSGGSVEQRVAATLLALADKVGQPRDGATLLQLPLTRSDLAAMTGTTTESASRVISTLRREGILTTGRRWTAIIDRDRLAALAQAPAPHRSPPAPDGPRRSTGRRASKGDVQTSIPTIPGQPIEVRYDAEARHVVAAAHTSRRPGREDEGNPHADDVTDPVG
jgi:CRP-like cAMP-binding protein